MYPRFQLKPIHSNTDNPLLRTKVSKDLLIPNQYHFPWKIRQSQQSSNRRTVIQHSHFLRSIWAMTEVFRLRQPPVNKLDWRAAVWNWDSAVTQSGVSWRVISGQLLRECFDSGYTVFNHCSVRHKIVWISQSTRRKWWMSVRNLDRWNSSVFGDRENSEITWGSETNDKFDKLKHFVRYFDKAI
jgi:hypothetical protein